jgi:CRP-like cAMP-binding protein
VLKASDTETLRSAIFFKSLPPPIFERLVSNGRVVEIEPEQTLFRSGDPAEAMFAVLRGLVKLSITGRDGTEAIVEIFHVGTSFAEALAFRRDNYPVTATALVPSRVFVVPNQTIQQAIADNPDAFGAILGATYEHLHKLVRQIERLKSNSGLERVAHFILASTPPGGDTGVVQIPYKKHILASLLGMKPETLSRSFARLKPYGVATEGRQILLKDRKALKRLFD